MSAGQTVAVLGASANPERYSNMALRRLRDAGHRVIPVNPLLADIEGLPVVKSLGEIKEPVDTLTLYVGPQRLAKLTQKILCLAPEKFIFNPDTRVPRRWLHPKPCRYRESRLLAFGNIHYRGLRVIAIPEQTTQMHIRVLAC